MNGGRFKRNNLSRENFLGDIRSENNLLFENSTWLRTEEAAEYLRTTPAQIRNWVYQGRIKSRKLLGRRLRFKKSELDLLLEEGDQ